MLSFSFTGEDDYSFANQIDFVVNVSTGLVRIEFSILANGVGNKSFSISATLEDELRANEFVADPLIVTIYGTQYGIH